MSAFSPIPAPTRADRLIADLAALPVHSPNWTRTFNAAADALDVERRAKLGWAPLPRDGRGS